MSDNQNNREALDDSAIYRLRWVADAMEAAKAYAQAHPEEVQSAHAGPADDAD